MTHPNAPSTERLRSKLSQQLRNLAEGTETGRVTLTKVGGQILRDAAISLDALTQENVRLQDALRPMASLAFDGRFLPKNDHLVVCGLGNMFLTAGDIRAARRALNGGTSDAE